VTAPLIGPLLPAGIRAVELRGDEPADPLLSAEDAALGAVSERRRRDFTVGRHCARRALAALGREPEPILPGPHREPCWPAGVLGSITHCGVYGAAAVARRGAIASLGIDAEPHEVLPDSVIGMVASDEERAWIATAEPGTCWDRVLFSAKESVYKAWFPLARRWLGFKDAVVAIDPGRGSFGARLLVPGPDMDGRPLRRLEGRFAVRDGLVLTAVVLSRR
jgi:4'-phosphopantetheinyl transferase EntD